WTSRLASPTSRFSGWSKLVASTRRRTGRVPDIPKTSELLDILPCQGRSRLSGSQPCRIDFCKILERARDYAHRTGIVGALSSHRAWRARDWRLGGLGRPFVRPFERVREPRARRWLRAAARHAPS